MVDLSSDALYAEGQKRYYDLMHAMQQEYDRVGDQLCREATAYPLAQRQLCEYYRDVPHLVRYVRPQEGNSTLTVQTDFGDVTLHTAFDPEIQSRGIIYPHRGT